MRSNEEMRAIVEARATEIKRRRNGAMAAGALTLMSCLAGIAVLARPSSPSVEVSTDKQEGQDADAPPTSPTTVTDDGQSGEVVSGDGSTTSTDIADSTVTTAANPTGTGATPTTGGAVPTNPTGPTGPNPTTVRTTSGPGPTSTSPTSTTLPSSTTSSLPSSTTTSTPGIHDCRPDELEASLNAVNGPFYANKTVHVQYYVVRKGPGQCALPIVTHMSIEVRNSSGSVVQSLDTDVQTAGRVIDPGNWLYFLSELPWDPTCATWPFEENPYTNHSCTPTGAGNYTVRFIYGVSDATPLPIELLP